MEEIKTCFLLVTCPLEGGCVCGSGGGGGGDERHGL